LEVKLLAGKDDEVGSGSTKVSYETALLPAVPNPANPSTNVHFTLARESQVQLVVYNQRGARVCDLSRGKLPAGDHLLKWRGQDNGGNEVASGVYFLKMVLPDQSLSQRVVIVR
jgi:flagellar hook assembly protein FlgD